MARKNSYHYGRVEKNINPDGSIKSYIVGPTPKKDGSNYRGARGAPLSSVIRALRLVKTKYVVISIYSRLYAGSPNFSWIAKVFDREITIDTIQAAIDDGLSNEQAAMDVFDLLNLPDFVAAWDVRQL